MNANDGGIGNNGGHTSELHHLPTRCYCLAVYMCFIYYTASSSIKRQLPDTLIVQHASAVLRHSLGCLPLPLAIPLLGLSLQSTVIDCQCTACKMPRIA